MVDYGQKKRQGSPDFGKTPGEKSEILYDIVMDLKISRIGVPMRVSLSDRQESGKGAGRWDGCTRSAGIRETPPLFMEIRAGGQTTGRRRR
jgi:hypothetical protein